MEQISQSVVSGGQALQLRANQYSVFANSNAISTVHGKLSELTADVKKLIGLQNKKLLTDGTVKSFKI